MAIWWFQILFAVSALGLAAALRDTELQHDLYIAGLFALHKPIIANSSCNLEQMNTNSAIQMLTFYCSFIKLQRELEFVKISIGIIIKDTCGMISKSLAYCLNTIRPNSSFPLDKLLGVIGEDTTKVTASLASCLGLFEVPQISYGATSSTLNNQRLYRSLLRTVPDDSQQAEALAHLIFSNTPFSTLFTVHSVGDYGEAGIEFFLEHRPPSGCIIDQLIIGESESEDKIAERIKQWASDHEFSRVKAVVLFVEEMYVERVTNAFHKSNVSSQFILFASDTWSSANVPSSKLKVVRLSLSLPHTARLSETKSCMCNTITKVNKLREREKTPLNILLESMYNEGGVTPRESTCDLPSMLQELTGSKVNWSPTYDDAMGFVRRAVDAFTQSLKDLANKRCSQFIEPQCFRSLNMSRMEYFNRYLREVKGQSDDPFQFVSGNSVEGLYSISLQDGDNIIDVGTWKNHQAKLIATQWTKFLDGVNATCNPVCPPGYRRDADINLTCCWVCVPCASNQIVVNGDNCVKCPLHQKPNSNYTACRRLQVRSNFTSTNGILVGCALLGMLSSLALIGFYVKHRSKPIIKASGLELSICSLVGLTLCFTSCFFFSVDATPVNCGLGVHVLSVGLSTCYSSLLVKVWLLRQIFFSRYIVRYSSPRWQITRVLVFALAHLILSVTLHVSDPMEVRFQDNKTYLRSQCAPKTVHIVMLIVFNILINFFTFFYAFRIRKVPRHFVDVRDVILVNAFSFLIWVISLGLAVSTLTEFQGVYVSLLTLFNSFIFLVVMFSIRVYVVLRRPGKALDANRNLKSAHRSEGESDGSTTVRYSVPAGCCL